MRFVVHINLSPRWVVLANAGFEAAHWSAIGAADAPDSVIMTHAARDDSVVLTHDLDFGAILAAAGKSKPSVVQIRADHVSPDVIGAQVILALRHMASDLQRGALVTVEPSRLRLRILPLL